MARSVMRFSFGLAALACVAAVWRDPSEFDTTAAMKVADVARLSVVGAPLPPQRASVQTTERQAEPQRFRCQDQAVGGQQGLACGQTSGSGMFSGITASFSELEIRALDRRMPDGTPRAHPTGPEQPMAKSIAATTENTQNKQKRTDRVEPRRIEARAPSPPPRMAAAPPKPNKPLPAAKPAFDARRLFAQLEHVGR